MVYAPGTLHPEGEQLLYPEPDVLTDSQLPSALTYPLPKESICKDYISALVII